MKTLRVVYTDHKRILAIGRPSTIAGLLESNESIVQNWYYNQPRKLESFLIQNPNKENDVLKAFAYWVMQKVFGFKNDQNHYGTIKRELQQFNEYLLKSLRTIAGRIAKQILKLIKQNKI